MPENNGTNLQIIENNFQNDEDLQAIPEWLDDSFVEKSLVNYYQDDSIKVKSCELVLATAKGENFASILFRVNVVYAGKNMITKTDKFIIKLAYESGFARNILCEMDAYNKELEMYETILPQMNKLLAMGNINDDLFAKTIDVNFHKKSIIFEDLSLRGFVMPLRSSGMDMVHAKILLDKLAKFHAASAVLQEQQPNILKNFKNGMINRDNCTFDNFYLTSLDVLIDTISDWEKYEHYAKKLRKLKLSLYENGRKSFDSKSHQINTLIHGDIWVNNTMFTYNSNNEPDKMMLVDFQFCCWTSPTVDLHYFFNTSLKEDLRLNNQDELIQYYYTAFRNTLIKLHYKNYIPTLQEFHIQMIENSFYAVISALLVQPVMLNENSEDADIVAIHTNGDKAIRFRKTMYANEKVRRNIRNLLPVFDRKGLLD